MFLDISNGCYESQFMSSLSDRIDEVMTDTAERRHISQRKLSKDWLSQIKSARNSWSFLCDAGLCESSPLVV